MIGSEIFGVVQLAIAVAAVVSALATLAFTRREGIRAGNRERLTWMHEALNQMGPLQDYGLQPNETKYVELQQWLKTSLAVAGARGRLPLTMALAERPIPEDTNDPVQRVAVVEAVEKARAELLAAIEKDATLASAGKRLK